MPSKLRADIVLGAKSATTTGISCSQDGGADAEERLTAQRLLVGRRHSSFTPAVSIPPGHSEVCPCILLVALGDVTYIDVDKNNLGSRYLTIAVLAPKLVTHKARLFTLTILY